jgi:hypothetical protein
MSQTVERNITQILHSVLSIADMGPRHGLTSCLSGRLIFNRATDWRRIGLIWVDAPFGAIVRWIKKSRYKPPTM